MFKCQKCGRSIGLLRKKYSYTEDNKTVKCCGKCYKDYLKRINKKKEDQEKRKKEQKKERDTKILNQLANNKIVINFAERYPTISFTLNPKKLLSLRNIRYLGLNVRSKLNRFL